MYYIVVFIGGMFDYRLLANINLYNKSDMLWIYKQNQCVPSYAYIADSTSRRLKISEKNIKDFMALNF